MQVIHHIQEENRRLQSECDQLEGEILQTGEGDSIYLFIFKHLLRISCCYLFRAVWVPFGQTSFKKNCEVDFQISFTQECCSRLKYCIMLDICAELWLENIYIPIMTWELLYILIPLLWMFILSVRYPLLWGCATTAVLYRLHYSACLIMPLAITLRWLLI